MLIKEKDSQEEAIRTLRKIANSPTVPGSIKRKVERELRTLIAGGRGEDNAAYFINFHYKDNDNWAVIHDLRLEHNGLVAQIDHLMIDRFLEFYVLESKSYSEGVKITERGEFLVWHNKRYIPLESPIEQNRRHVRVLEKVLRGADILPKRLGVTLPPTFRSYVLISPKSRVIRPSARGYNTDGVIKMDEFARYMTADADRINPVVTMGAIAKMVSVETLEEIARKLVALHRPMKIDYYAKYGVEREKSSEMLGEKAGRKRREVSSKYFCAKCGKAISKKVAIFCFQNKGRFGGRAYCFDCQKTI